MPDFGQIIADTYNRPVHVFANFQSLTHLPHFYSVQFAPAIAMAFVGNNHFVALTLEEMCPIPDVISSWEINADEKALKQKVHFESRIKQFKDREKRII